MKQNERTRRGAAVVAALLPLALAGIGCGNKEADTAASAPAANATPATTPEVQQQMQQSQQADAARRGAAPR